MNVQQEISNAWHSYISGTRESAIIELGRIGGFRFDTRRRKEILSISDFLEGYEHPALTQVSATTSHEFATAIMQNWLFRSSGVIGVYHLRNVIPLVSILGTGYHLEIDSQEMEFDLYGRRAGIQTGGMNSTQLPIFYADCLNLWPEITVLPELAWFSRAIYIRIIKYLQLDSGLTEIARVNTANDRRFASTLRELLSVGLIATNLSVEDRLSNISIQGLMQLAHDSNIKLGVIPKKNSKKYICEKIADKIDPVRLEITLEQHNANHPQVRPLLSNISVFKKYVSAEINRIDLYTNWLGEFVQSRMKITSAKTEHSSIFWQEMAPIPNLYEEDPAEQNQQSVPYFKQYYADPEMMDKPQRAFFDFLVDEIEHGRFPSVHGNISYLFAYTYPFIMKWNEQGYEYVYDKLLNLAEGYHQEENFTSYCKWWGHECLLALRKFDKYLELTTPAGILPSRTFNANVRCNILYQMQYPTQASDILSLFGWKSRITLSNYTQQNLSLFSDILNDVFVETEESDGPWLQRMLAAQKNPQTISKTLFVGVPMSSKPELDFPLYDFSAEYGYFVDVIGDLIRKAENRLRDNHQLPKIGEGWISETRLYNCIREAFPQTDVVHHGRPNWLGRQHLDIWLPRWKVAVEYHGSQHFQPVDFFGGDDAFKATKERDERKQRLCEDNNIRLIVATTDDTHEQIVEEIKKLHL